MLLNAGIIAFIVAAATRSVAAALAVPCLILVAVGITMAVIRHPEQRAVFMGDDDDAREYLNRVEPVIAEVAAGLHVALPTARIIDDEALNALSAGSDRDGAVAYTSGLLDAFAGSGDELLEAVTAHLVGRLACGDNGLTLFSFGVLAWVLETFDVMLRLVRVLRRMGNRCLGFAFGRDVGFRGDEASFYARLLLWVFAIALGLELLAAALALFVAGGALALVAVLTLKALAWQRIRFADAIAAEVAGSEAMHAVLSRLNEQPTELARGGVALQDLCFAGPRPQQGYVEYAPGIPLRLAWLRSRAGSKSTGLLAPVTSAVALTAVLGLLGLVTAKVPYGRPFGTPGGAVTVPVTAVAAAEGNADGSPTPQAQTAPSVQPGSGLATLGSAPASRGTSPGSGLSSSPSVTGTSGVTSQAPPAEVSSPDPGPSGNSASPDASPSPSPSVSPSPSPSPTSAGPPAAPSGVLATPNGQYAIAVTWVNNATNATGFRIDNGCPVGSCAPGATLATTTGLTTKTTFTVTPGSYQCFRVQAFNSSGSSGWSSYGCTQTQGFVVPGTQSWADTGVTVPAGITLKITASGTVSVTSTYSVGPAGTQSCIPTSAYPGIKPPFLAPSLPCWSLVARIGNGAPFEVGSSVTITTTAGRLYLSVNDNNFTDNSGSWTADIKEGG
jgi:Zn-dependent protease with chaperone function